MATTKPEFFAESVEECWEIATHEAERYQRAVNKIDLNPSATRGEAAAQAIKRNTLVCKRNAVGRIARLIKFGPGRVERNGNGDT